MGHQAADDMPFVTQTSGCQAQVSLEVKQVGAAHVAQFDILQVRPDALVGVQFGSVARQLLEAQTFGCTLGQEVFDGLTAMNWRTVPDHQQLARNASQQMLEETHDLGTAERVVLDAQQQLATRGNATDDRQMVTGEREVQRRWVAAWGQAADHRGQQGKARFVYPNDRAPFSYRPLFSAGQRSVRHCSMAASLR
jgi:hypothetical protein